MTDMTDINSKSKKITNFIKREIVLVLPLVLFVFFVCKYPVFVTNDTHQYAHMHIHRDPMYCLFLWVLRILIGGEGEIPVYMNVAVVLQNIFAWLSVVALTRAVRDSYKLKNWMTAPICILCLAPHLITPFVTQSGMVMSNSIMSEAITFPLFYTFIAYSIRMMEDEDHTRYIWLSLVTSWILSLARGQMMVTMIVWVIVRIAGVIRREGIKGSLKGKLREGKAKMWGRVAVTVAAFLCMFTLRGVFVNTYNLIFNNYYMGTTFSEVSVLTNIVYASDRDMVEKIEDEDAKRFFLMTYDEADRQGLNYKYSSGGILQRGRDLENAHDPIKYSCIDEYWRPVHWEESVIFENDYELETAEQDRVAGLIIKDLLPECIGRWVYDYLALCIFGFVRTVAIDRGPLFIYAAILYLCIIAFIIYQMIKAKSLTGTPLLRFGLFTLLCVCANVCGTATVIMCLSRYMIYVLPLVYIYILVGIYKSVPVKSL